MNQILKSSFKHKEEPSIKIKRITCCNCNRFVASIISKNILEVNPKSKKIIIINKNQYKITCKCGEVHIIHI